ncbi:copper fist DNA binding domain-containing protein [Spinellus fusiger]|nr:copper fist DNA binding domain-containing protein [Spinellus fusiger]
MYITGEDGVLKKFACLTCIKGHRSSGCLHTDRHLIEIKKKGRPVSQCAKCRERRKINQVHTKCICIKPLASSVTTSCSQCHNAFCFCLCQTQEVYWSSSSSDGTVTPPTDRLYAMTSPDLPSKILPCEKTSHKSPMIPIHDPTDDLNSDTPVYNPSEDAAPDRIDVLGELSRTSSEDLMHKIYSGVY